MLSTLSSWRVGFFPCYSFRPKSILRKQTLVFLVLFVCWFVFGVFLIIELYLMEFQASFIQQILLFSSDWSMWHKLCFCASENKRGRGNTINIFHNYFSECNSANWFHGLTVKAGGTRVVMQSCLLGIASKNMSCLNAYIFGDLKLISYDTGLL